MRTGRGRLSKTADIRIITKKAAIISVGKPIFFVMELTVVLLAAVSKDIVHHPFAE